MAGRDPNTLDLTQQKLRLASDLRFWPVRERGELVYRIEIPTLHRFFRVGYQEYVFLSLLDGNTTIPQACGLAAAKLGVDAPTATDAEAIARWLLTNDLAHLPNDPSPQRESVDRDRRSAIVPKYLSRLNPFWIKVPLPRAASLIGPLCSLVSWMFATRATVVGSCAIVAGLVVLLTRWGEFVESSSALFLPGNWFGILVAWVALKIVHELAHAVVCQRMGGQVREVGVVFVLFAPLAYVDVSSCWRMSSRWSRIAVAAAGMYVELVIAAVAILLWAQTDSISAKFLFYQVVVSAGLSTLVFNANVLMQFDGYFILADAIDVPNLSREASTSVNAMFNRVITGRQSPDRSLGTWRKYFVLAYGLAVLAWRVIVCVTLFIASSTMFAGAGIVIAMMGLWIWLVGPIRKFIALAKTQVQAGWTTSLRPITVSSSMIVAAGWFVLWCPIPTAVNVPSIVEYAAEATVRSRASGFVTAIHVADGQDVAAGDRLVQLENRELTGRLAELQLKWEENEIRLRQATELHDASALQIARENQSALVRQMQPVRQQVESLSVTAPRAGRVVARGIASREGTYVKEGDVLMTVASEADKELIAVVDQSVVQQVRLYLGQHVRVRNASFTDLGGTLQRIEPRATDRLPSAAMAVTEGGTLAVRPGADNHDVEALRLLEPAFRGRIELSPRAASELSVGTRMSAAIGYRTQPLATRWRDSIRALWHASNRDTANR